ncbi:MAG: hypothetical protein ACYSUT_06305 [Planctomycetota bacterium]
MATFEVPLFFIASFWGIKRVLSEKTIGIVMAWLDRNSHFQCGQQKGKGRNESGIDQDH